MNYINCDNKNGKLCQLDTKRKSDLHQTLREIMNFFKSDAKTVLKFHLSFFLKKIMDFISWILTKDLIFGHSFAKKEPTFYQSIIEKDIEFRQLVNEKDCEFRYQVNEKDHNFHQSVDEIYSKFVISLLR